MSIVAGIQSALDTIDNLRALADADPSTLNPIARGARAGLRQTCRGLQSLPFGGYTLGPGFGAASGYVCGPFHDDEGGSPGGPPQVPYSGGQCPTLYTASFRVSATDSDQGPQQSPSSGPEVVTVQGPVSVTPATLNGQVRGFRLSNANGSNASTRFVGENPVGLDYTLTLVRQDGMPDDCGDPEPVGNPPTGLPPYDWGEPEVDPGTGLPITTPEPTGPNPTINIDVGGINVGFNFGGGGGPDPQPLPPEFGETSDGPPAIPSGDAGTDYDFGNPPEGSEWVGVRYKLTTENSGLGGVVGSDPVTIYPKIIGNLRLKVRTDTASTVYADSPIRLTALEGAKFRSIPALVVVGAYVNALPQFSVTVIPVSAKIEEVN